MCGNITDIVRPELTSNIGVCPGMNMFLYGVAVVHCCLRQMQGKYPPAPLS